MILEILKGMRVIKTYQGEEIQTRMGLEKGRAYFDELIHVARLQALGTCGNGVFGRIERRHSRARRRFSGH